MTKSERKSGTTYGPPASFPDLNIEVKQTVPEEVLRLIEEIEGRYPYKVHVDPIERDSSSQPVKAAVEPQTEASVVEKKEPEKSVDNRKEPQEILEVLEAPSEVEAEREPEKTEIAEQSVDTVGTVKEPQEILEILEAPSEAAATEEPAAETVVEGVKEEQLRRQRRRRLRSSRSRKRKRQRQSTSPPCWTT